MLRLEPPTCTLGGHYRRDGAQIKPNRQAKAASFIDRLLQPFDGKVEAAAKRTREPCGFRDRFLSIGIVYRSVARKRLNAVAVRDAHRNPKLPPSPSQHEEREGCGPHPQHFDRYYRRHKP